MPFRLKKTKFLSRFGITNQSFLIKGERLGCQAYQRIVGVRYAPTHQTPPPVAYKRISATDNSTQLQFSVLHLPHNKQVMTAQDPSTISAGIPNVLLYTPAQIPASGTISSAEKVVPLVFQPLRIRNLELQNRIMVS